MSEFNVASIVTVEQKSYLGIGPYDTPDDAVRAFEADRAALAAKDAEIAKLREALQAARSQAVDDTLAALTAHELYQYRPKAFHGFIAYAETLKDEANAQLWRAALKEKADV